jgi:hypothetical protein
MIVTDSSNSDSPRSEPLPKRRFRKSTAEAQLEEPPSQPALGKRMHEETGVDLLREEVPFKRKSPEKKTCKDDDKVADQTSKANQRHTPAAPGDVPLKPDHPQTSLEGSTLAQPSDTAQKVLFKFSFRACKRC